MTRHYPDLGRASDWLCCVGNFDSTNQEHDPDRGSDASSVWNFCAPSSRQMSAVFLERLHYSNMSARQQLTVIK